MRWQLGEYVREREGGTKLLELQQDTGIMSKQTIKVMDNN